MIQIRTATRKDAAAAHQLICELAKFENALEEVTTTLEQFEEDGFGEKPLYYLKVAEEIDVDGKAKVVGMCLFYVIYSTWKGKIVYLDDLVVTQSHRRQGIGKQLIDALFKEAHKMGANQVRWHVLDWNEPAIQFYKQLGMKLESDWITCKLSKKQLNSYING